ncbi:MAG: hypothetical protein N2260_09080 [Syntrophobacterales bacterium]|nr:hypothetical protein [Syntrophobacterales bacterium]
MENLSSPTASPPSIVERTLEDSSPAIQPAPKERTPSKTIEPPTSKGAPQAMASIKLVDNARQLRVNGKVDEAIRTLERAIELDAYNGEAFYEMALCWQNKKDFNKALKFADRAEQVYSKNPEKLKKVYLLKAQILESTGKKEEAYKYRQRAK